MLEEIIKKIKETNIYTVPFAVKESELNKRKECLVYNYDGNGMSNRFKLRLRIISKSLERNLEIQKLLERTLVGVGDTVLVPKITSIEISGGTTAREEESKTVHTFLFIDCVGYM